MLAAVFTFTVLAYGLTDEEKAKYEKELKRLDGIIQRYSEDSTPPVKMFFRTAKLKELLGNKAEALKIYKKIAEGKTGDAWEESAKAELWVGTKKGTCPKRIINVIKVDKPPVIDGDLSDPCWAKAEKGADYVMENSKDQKPENQTEFFMCRDDDNLYLGVNCYEKTMDKILAAVTSDQLVRGSVEATVWNDDCVEIFFNQERDYYNYNQLIINTLEAMYDGRCTLGNCDVGKGWETGTIRKVKKYADKWVLELSIPLKDFGLTVKPGDVWGFNLRRCRRVTGQELSDWNYNGRMPDKYGFMVFK
jgi:hypothetical protein